MSTIYVLPRAGLYLRSVKIKRHEYSFWARKYMQKPIYFLDHEYSYPGSKEWFECLHICTQKKLWLLILANCQAVPNPLEGCIQFFHIAMFSLFIFRGSCYIKLSYPNRKHLSLCSCIIHEKEVNKNKEIAKNRHGSTISQILLPNSMLWKASGQHTLYTMFILKVD